VIKDCGGFKSSLISSVPKQIQYDSMDCLDMQWIFSWGSHILPGLDWDLIFKRSTVSYKNRAGLGHYEKESLRGNCVKILSRC
jgi:hypothetical protein